MCPTCTGTGRGDTYIAGGRAAGIRTFVVVVEQVLLVLVADGALPEAFDRLGGGRRANRRHRPAATSAMTAGRTLMSTAPCRDAAGTCRTAGGARSRRAVLAPPLGRGRTRASRAGIGSRSWRARAARGRRKLLCVVSDSPACTDEFLFSRRNDRTGCADRRPETRVGEAV